jgi:probable DNA metabolism protein
MLIYTYDNSLEGLLTCVFEIYARKEEPDNIAREQGLQHQLEQIVHPVPTCEAQWQRVQTGIRKKLGHLAWEKVRVCYCASNPQKEMLIYRYLRQGFSRGRSALDDLSHPDILAIEELYRSVGMEQQRMIMFARFAKINSGSSRDIYYARINPKHSVLPLIMDHFSARFNVQPFVIYDEVHRVAGLSEQGQWILSQDTDDAMLPSISSDDKEYQDLWKTFYNAICIPERINEKRRMAFMPKRLWKHLPEMHP